MRVLEFVVSGDKFAKQEKSPFNIKVTSFMSRINI